jgi:hypothetical protein
MNVKLNEADIDRLEAQADMDTEAVLEELDRNYNERGEYWGECPYCGLLGWLGYKDHCSQCL